MSTLGSKIRELRQEKRMTLEKFASELNVTSELVSEWEMGYSLPDSALIPVLAAFFQVSTDVLLGSDLFEINKNVEAIIKESRSYFFTAPKRYIETMKDTLNNYPGNEALLIAMLEAYEYDLCANSCTDYLDDIIDIAEQILAECSDFMKVCDIKKTQAVAYLKKGDYDKAKVILETLPDIKKHDAIALHLSGRDKLDGAVQSRYNHLQGLCTACDLEGDAWFHMSEHLEVTSCDIIPEDYISEAMKCYQKGLDVFELFFVSDMEGDNLYLGTEMHTIHYCLHQKIAACHKKLGQMDECKAEVEASYRIVSDVLNSFEEKCEDIMCFFNQHLRDNGLAEFVR